MMTVIQTHSSAVKNLTTCHALKEWHITVQALEQGQTILLLRKGGIREQGGQFSVKYRQVLLYPTVEHQRSDLLKPEYKTQVQPVIPGWHPEQIDIRSWAEITHILPLNSSINSSTIFQLDSFHIWTQQLVQDRLNYKPNKPLFVLLLRIYKLPQLISIPYHSSYGGCRSWLDLNQPIPLDKSFPSLTDDEYHQQVENIQKILNT